MVAQSRRSAGRSPTARPDVSDGMTCARGVPRRQGQRPWGGAGSPSWRADEGLRRGAMAGKYLILCGDQIQRWSRPASACCSSVDLQDVLVELGETARASDGGVVFFFDEMQFAERDDLQALLAAFHRIAQRQLPVALVCAGLPQLPGRLAEASSYAERLFQYVEIGRLTEDAAKAALMVPASREGVEYEQAALDFILARAERYPFFLQTYGRYVWLVAERSPITERDAKAADTIAREQLDSGFQRARFNRATAAERRYLAAIAELGDGPQQTAEVSARLGADQRRTALVRQPHRRQGPHLQPAVRLRRLHRAPVWRLHPTTTSARVAAIERRRGRSSRRRGRERTDACSARAMRKWRCRYAPLLRLVHTTSMRSVRWGARLCAQSACTRSVDPRRLPRALRRCVETATRWRTPADDSYPPELDAEMTTPASRAG